MAKISATVFVETLDIPAEEISERIGLAPDEKRAKGCRLSGGKSAPFHCWSISSALEVTDDPQVVGDAINQAVQDVLGRLAPFADSFRAVAAGNEAGLAVGVTANEIPPLALSAKAINSLSILGLSADMDLTLVG